MKRLLLATCLCWLCAGAMADDGINPDRPDFTNGPDVVGKGTSQIETGLNGLNDDGLRSTGTATMLRLGLSDTVELRLSSAGRINAYQDGASASGWGGLQWGAKWKISPGNDSGLPSMAWLLTVSPPSGSAVFRNPGTRVELDMPLSWDLPDGFDLGVMPGVYRDHDATGKSGWASLLSAGLGHDLAENVHGFLEVAAQQLAPERLGGHVWTLDTGAGWQLSPDWQVDAAVFRGISHDAPDWTWTVGLSARF